MKKIFDEINVIQKIIRLICLTLICTVRMSSMRAMSIFLN